MSRRPKPKNTLSAGERVALFKAEQEEKQKRLSSGEQDVPSASEDKGDLVLKDEAAVGTKKQAEKKLPRPQHATVKVDFAIPVGEIKPLHSMCNGPRSYGADISGVFKEIGVPFVRFDCTDTAMSARAVDISRIFKNFDADPSDEDNYDFECTDAYVEAALLSGAVVMFRLGESRDLLEPERKLPSFTDLDAMARVCVNIIRHYNDGWANGRYYGIEYFEIGGCGEDSDAELEVYRRVANAIKLYDENIKVGGLSFDGFGSSAKAFLRYCRKNRVPLDFVTVDCFCSDPEAVGGEAERFVALARELGFDELEIIVGKWSYIDGEVLSGLSLEKALSGKADCGEIRRRIFESQGSVKGAAFAMALLLRLSHIDGIKTACFYDAQPTVSPFCAITDRFGAPEKPFYSFKAYSELYRAKNAVLCESEQIEGFLHTGIYADAAVSDNGEAVVVLASFGGCGVVDLRLDNISDELYNADIYMLDGVKDLTLCDSVAISGMRKRLLLNVSEFGVVMVKLR